VDPARDSRSRARSALRRIRRWLRPPRRLRPTRAGWSFFAITFGVGFAALNTGNNLLYLVLALMLSFLVLSGVLSESALRGIAVRRRLPRELYAATTGRVALEIANRQRRVPAFAVVVEDRIRTARGGRRAAGRVFALRVAPGGVENRTYRLRPDRRGVLKFEDFRVATRFPFGLFSKSLELDAEQTALVYPEIQPVAVPPGGGAASDEGETVSGPDGDGAAAAGLRDFVPGDPARRIHWRGSLRRGALVVRDVDAERDAEVEVRLRTGGRAPGVGFEERVVWAASEVAAWIDVGRRVALRTEDAHFPAASGSRQRARLLSFLARVEPQPAPEGP
jgi:uncharacterized protein (DUF58 family)